MAGPMEAPQQGEAIHSGEVGVNHEAGLSPGLEGLQKTTGIDVLTHKKDFQIEQAGYTPVVSDGHRLILVGYYTVIGLEPTTP